MVRKGNFHTRRRGQYTNPKEQRLTTEMRTKLVKIDDEERCKGRALMRRVKERWDLEFPEQASVSMHNLRNNASRF